MTNTDIMAVIVAAIGGGFLGVLVALPILWLADRLAHRIVRWAASLKDQ